MAKKVNKVKWTICIASVPARSFHFDRLMKVLLPQVDKYKGQIEVLVFWNNFEYSMGYLRQSLMDEARGEYINHIDDDDLVPDDYCETIMPHLDGVDYIGHKVKFFDLGIEKAPVYHSLKYDKDTWYDDENGYYRGVTHLNPVRTAIARESTFPESLNIGEDELWAKGMKGKCKTEYFIDKFLYTYFHAADDPVAYKYNDNGAAVQVTLQGYRHAPDDTPIKPIIDSNNLRFHPRSTPDGKKD